MAKASTTPNPRPVAQAVWEDWVLSGRIFTIPEAPLTPHPGGLPLASLRASPEGLKGVIKSPGRPNHRPRVLSPPAEALIRQWGREGRGARAILRELGERGVVVSLSTISRRLRELRQGEGG